MPFLKGKMKKDSDAPMMKEGKPDKMSLGIAYNVKRRGPKKMAKGGAVPSKDQDFVTEDMTDIDKANTAEEMNMKEESTDPKHINADHMMAKGGDVEEHYSSIADAILAKSRKAKMMADGGEVNIDSNNQEQPNSFYPRNEDHTVGEPADQDFSDITQPEDSNEDGHEMPQDSKEESLVDSIRRKSKKTK